MPELTDENIQKVKEQLHSLGQKARDAIGPEKAAAISASVPVVKSAARSAAIRSLRAMQTLCAAGAQKLENGAAAQTPQIEQEKTRTAPPQEAFRAPEPDEPDEMPREQEAPRPEPEAPRPVREMPQPQPRSSRPAPDRSAEPEIIRPKSTTHARRTFTYFGAFLALIAAGALVFSGITLLRILRPRFGRPNEPRSIYEPVARTNGSSAGIIRIQRNNSSAGQQQPKQPAATPNKPPAASAESELPQKVKINYEGVNVRDDHFIKGTNVLGKASQGTVTVLDFWDGKEQYPWYKIQAKNVTGWVYGRYVDLPPKPKANAATALNDGERMGRVSHTGVNVRDGHATKGTRVLTRMGNRDVVILDEWKPDGAAFPWYKIRLDNGEGWIYGKYVDLK